MYMYTPVCSVQHSIHFQLAGSHSHVWFEHHCEPHTRRLMWAQTAHAIACICVSRRYRAVSCGVRQYIERAVA